MKFNFPTKILNSCHLFFFNFPSLIFQRFHNFSVTDPSPKFKENVLRLDYLPQVPDGNPSSFHLSIFHKTLDFLNEKSLSKKVPRKFAENSKVSRLKIQKIISGSFRKEA